MPVVGEAHIIVRALTDQVEKDLKRGLQSVSGSMAGRAGSDLGDAFTAGFNRNAGANIFSRIADGIRSMAPGAEAARLQLNNLIKTGFKLNVGFTLIAGSIGVLIGGLGALVGAAGGAAASLTALVGSMIALRVGGGLAGFAMKGVGQAVSAAANSSNAGAKSVKELREELQQLRFEAEAAALAEEEAGLRLEQARENLARTADLPVNSLARREAELNFKQAELAYRQAKDRTSDLNEEVKKGVQNTGGNDPFAGLTKSQKAFAQFLLRNRSIIADLRESVASGFLPLLQEQLERIINSKLLDVVEKGFSGIGVALGKATKLFTDQMLEPTNIKNLTAIFEDIAFVVENFGSVFGKFGNAFNTILAASGPLIRNFIGFLDRSADSFNNFLGSFTDTELENFFVRAGEIAGDFGEIFGNIFDGLGAIIEANFKPGSGGDMLLQFLIDSTEGFARLGDDAQGLEQYFKDVAANLITILDGIGGIFVGLTDLAKAPEIGEFFDILKQAGPFIGDIAEKSLKALPDVAELFVALAEIANSLTDSGAIETYFGILKDGAQAVADILKNEWLVNILNFFGILKAISLATGGLINPFRLIGEAILGNATVLSGTFGTAVSVVKTEVSGILSFFKQMAGSIFTAGTAFNSSFNTGLFQRFQSGFATLGGGLKNMTIETGYFGKAFAGVAGFVAKHPILTAIGLLVGLFVTLFNTNEDFRNAVMPFFERMAGVFKVVLAILKPVQDLFMTLWKDTIEPMLVGPGGLIEGFTELCTNLLPIIGSLITSIVIPAVTLLAEGLKVIIVLVQDILNFFKLVGDAFVKLFSGDFIGAFKSAIGAVVIAIAGALQGIWNVIIGIVNGAISLINTIIGAIDNIVPESLDRVQKIPQANFTKDIAAGFGMAKGGTVMPSRGGTLVTIAEAGRPERVEPLDPDGLSKRDKAMIQMLSGGAGGGVNITVNAAPGMDENELAAIVSRRISYELRRGATA